MMPSHRTASAASIITAPIITTDASNEVRAITRPALVDGGSPVKHHKWAEPSALGYRLIR